MMYTNYQVIVVGAGHAGCEAALASARRGVKTLLITGNIDMIGAMSCNPAIGGLGKGHLVKEIDALGGEMGKNIDETGIQFRRLNTNKGPAVQGTRAQADKYLYRDRMRWVIENQNNLIVKQGIVKSIGVKNSTADSIVMTSGEAISTESVIITTGTFLRGLCHVGLKNFAGGRAGDMTSNELSHSLLNDCGLELLRLKTGTVPRLDGKTINFEGLDVQYGDTPIPLFSFAKTHRRQRQIACFITHTNARTHDVIRRDLDKSPLFQGVIKGTGPRYCPSIEDKVLRFRDKERHQIFLEPEGLCTREFYPNGLSTSLPHETQLEFIRSIRGLEHAEITRPGYAVEYDAVNPIQLRASLETKTVRGLFLAGQINGTSGYEEAAVQGFMAGINAIQYVNRDAPVIVSRHEGYIGVLIDDLVTKGIGGEPYRMFTSRAENRMSLREDNADIRLRPIGHKLGLVSNAEWREHERKLIRLQTLRSYATTRRPEQTSLQAIERLIDKTLPESATIEQILRRPEITHTMIERAPALFFGDCAADSRLIYTLLGDIKYDGYVSRYARDIAKMTDYDKVHIPAGIDYSTVPGFSIEVRDKLTAHKPENLAQALRIPGVTPAAIAQLEVYIAGQRRRSANLSGAT